MAWKARLFMGLMLTVMLLAIAGPAMADNDRQDRREARQEFRDDFFFDDCCDDDFNNDDVEFVLFNDEFDNDFFFNEDDFFFDDDEFFFVSDCPFAGDFSGPVNEFDCFD